MNDSELEDQLRAWRPAAPSPELGRRIAQDLAAPVVGAAVGAARSGLLTRPTEKPGAAWRWLRDLGWALAGATAALTVVALFPPSDPPAAPLASSAVVADPPAAQPAAAFEPAGSTSELLATEDSAQLVETNDGPVREVRYSFLERHAWTNPQTGARMEVEVPREDVYLVPVSLQ